jgi:phosphate transport system protein
MSEHIVKAYDEDLKSLHDLIQHMGDLTLQQIEKALHSLLERNDSLAQEVIEHDYEIDLLETKVDTMAMRILALRQPVASDLRMVIAALKISHQVERSADYAGNIAQHGLTLNTMPALPLAQELVNLVKTPKKMIERALKAFTTSDVNLALHVWQMDREVDGLYGTYIQKLFKEMITDPSTVSSCTHLLFAAKNIERIGDQATNIAEAVYTMVTGKPFNESESLHEI